VPPLAALRDVAVDRSDSSVVRGVIGALLTLAGVGLLASAVFGSGDVLIQAGLGAAVLLAGVIVLGPIAARPMSAILGSPLPRLRGVTGELARQNAMRNPRRTSGTAAALMVGVAIVTLFTVVASSIKASIDEEVSRSFGGDLVVATAGFSGSGLDPAMAEEINRLPEVETAAGVGLGAAVIDGEDRVFTVADPHTLASVLDVDVQEGSVDDLGTTSIAVAEDTAEDAGYELGSQVEMEFLDGRSETVTVGAIYAEGAGNSVGTFLVPDEIWAPHTPQQIDIQVLIDLDDGVDLETGRAAVEGVTTEFGNPDVQTRDEYVDQQAGGIDILLNIVYVMLALAIVIALMGISNTLSLSVHERTRELGLLRAVGQTQSQTRSMVRWESVVVALFGTVGGLALGTFLGWALMRAIRAQEGIGTFAAPVGQLALVLALGAIVGIIAAIRPARRAARLDLLQAIATE
jgi:putative ABC transport system permease protein